VSRVTAHLIISEYQGESIFFDVEYINWFHRCLTKDGLIFIGVSGRYIVGPILFNISKNNLCITIK
jgi:hypothetical protein